MLNYISINLNLILTFTFNATCLWGFFNSKQLQTFKHSKNTLEQLGIYILINIHIHTNSVKV